jgi:AcrR family transcriptional regulator
MTSPRTEVRRGQNLGLRRTQRERSEATVSELLRVGRELFAANGYASTSLDAVCARADVSKGALYHHFSNKESLFLAVYEAEQQTMRRGCTAAFKAETDSWVGIYRGCRTLLEVSAAPDLQRIVYIDAPGAIGWPAMRRLQADCKALLIAEVQMSIDQGRISGHDAGMLGSMLYGAVAEMAMSVAAAERSAERLLIAKQELAAIFSAVDPLKAVEVTPATLASMPGDAVEQPAGNTPW